MEAILGASWPVFIGVTVILFGGAAFLMGQAIGGTWRPAWQNVLYGLLLGLATGSSSLRCSAARSLPRSLIW